LREHLLAAALEPEHPRDWRPHLLAFSDDSHRRAALLRFASCIEGGSGLTTVVRFVEGEGLKVLRLKEEAEKELAADVRAHGSDAFPLVVAVPSLSVGVYTLVQSFGVGPIRGNTILLNWFEDPPRGIFGIRELQYGRNLRAAFRLGCNIVVLDAKEEEWVALEALSSQERRIDVWWWGDATSHLMLLLAYLMKRKEEWENATIRVLASADKEESGTDPESLRKTLEDIRIEAAAEVVHDPGAESVWKHSSDAAMVFLPFRFRKNRLAGPFGEQVEGILSRLPITALVLAAEDIDLDAEPEEGKAGEMAAALDVFSDLERKAREAEKDAAGASREAEEKLGEVSSALGTEGREEFISRVKIAMEAREKAQKAARRAAKVRAKADNAAKELEALGGEPVREKEGNAALLLEGTEKLNQ
jgi:hypothetical protein